MFKYAAGKALLLEKKAPFKVDVSSYEGYKLRSYELETLFTITAEKATKKEMKHYPFGHPVKRVWNALAGKKVKMLGLLYEESSMLKIISAAYNWISPPTYKKYMKNLIFISIKIFLKQHPVLA